MQSSPFFVRPIFNFVWLHLIIFVCILRAGASPIKTKTKKICNLKKKTIYFALCQNLLRKQKHIIIPNNRDIRSAHIPRRDLPPILLWAHDKCNSYRNLCHASECIANSTNSRSPISSISQSDWRRQFSPGHSNRTVRG